MGLVIGTVILAAALTANFVFPEETARITEKLGIAEKYENALETMGRVMSGGENTAEAVPDEANAEEVLAADAEETEFTAVVTESLAVPDMEELILPSDGMTCSEAAVASFREQQSKYEEYGVPAKATYEMPALALNFICPMEGTVSSPFGYRTHPVDGKVRFHYGTDIAAPLGTDICVFADGRVKAAGDSSSYGKYVMVEHEDGVVSMYAHCSKLTAKEGQELLKGDKIAEVGNTGNATGACLHFEMIIDGKYVNPEYYVSWN